MIIEIINGENEKTPIIGFKIAMANNFQNDVAIGKSFVTAVFSIVIVKSGKIKIVIQDDAYSLKAKEIIVIPVNSILVEKKSKNNVKLFVIAFTKQFAFENFLKKEIVGLFNLLFNKQPVVVSINADNFLVISLTCRLLVVISKERAKAEIEKELYKIAVDLLTHELALLNLTNRIQRGLELTRKDYLTIQFLALLASNGLNRHSANFYSDCLCVTSGYLNKVIKQKTGKTVKIFIAEVVIMEAKRLLSDCKLSSKEISDQMEFSSVSAFSNFFKRNTSITPSEYRKHMK